MKNVVRCCAVLLALSCLLCVGASAQALSVRRADGVGEAVNLWERDGGDRFLFLPAYMQGQPLIVSYGDAQALRMGDLAIGDGETTDAIEGGCALVVTEGGKEHRVTVMASENLPAVHLTTQSGSLAYLHAKKGNKEPGAMTIVAADGSVDFSGELQSVKGHGNATFAYEKKSYQIKLGEKSALLGMGEGKCYVLLANQHENSLLRNRLTLTLAAELGLRFTPECRSVDLYVNGEYRGSYLLTDKVTISSGCVDITDGEDALERANEAFIQNGFEPEAYGEARYVEGTHKGSSWPIEPEDVTGGYLFELEYETRYKDEESGVVTARGQAVVVKAPKRMSEAQGAYASELLNRFERAIFAQDGVDPQSGMHYAQIADLPSLARKYLIEEVSKNYDANRSSQYFYKDSDHVDPLLYAGSVWDYDSAWGNYARQEKLDVAAPTGLIADRASAYSWWSALCRQEDFHAEVVRVYEQELRPMLMGVAGEWAMSAGRQLRTLDAYERELSASAAMNFARWRVLNHATRAVKTGATYSENIETLRTWIVRRVAWLDERWGVP